MPKFRQKPGTVTAFLWDATDSTSLRIRDWIEKSVAKVVDTDHIEHLWNHTAGCYVLPSGKLVFAPYHTRCLIIMTMDGHVVARPGEYIVEDPEGKFIPWKPDIFRATYESAPY